MSRTSSLDYILAFPPLAGVAGRAIHAFFDSLIRVAHGFGARYVAARLGLDYNATPTVELAFNLLAPIHGECPGVTHDTADQCWDVALAAQAYLAVLPRTKELPPSELKAIDSLSISCEAQWSTIYSYATKFLSNVTHSVFKHVKDNPKLTHTPLCVFDRGAEAEGARFTVRPLPYESQLPPKDLFAENIAQIVNCAVHNLYSAPA